jgi:hypothetical protein
MKRKEILLVIILIFVGILFSLYGFRTPKSVSSVPTKTTYVWKTKTPTSTPSKTATPMPDTPTPRPTTTPTSTAVSVRNFSDDWEQVFEMRSNCVDFDELGGIWSIYTDENDAVTVQRYFEDEWQIIDVPEDIVLNRTCPHVLQHNDVWFYGNWTDSIRDVFRYYQNEWITVQVPITEKGEMQTYSSLHVDSYGRFWMGQWECSKWYPCLHKYENGSWQEIDLPFHHITSISSDERGNIYVGGQMEDGLAIYNNQSWSFIDVTTIWGIPAKDGESPHSIHLHQFRENQIIATVVGNPLTIISVDGKINHIPNPAFSSRISRMALFEAYNQRIWFTFNSDLLGYYDKNNQQWVEYQNTPANNYFFEGTNIFKDRNTGEIWFLLVKWAGDEKGLYRLKANIPQ